MSIIHDALKKVQKNFEHKKELPPVSPTTPPPAFVEPAQPLSPKTNPDPYRPRPTISLELLAIIILSIVVAVLAFTFIVYHLRSPQPIVILSKETHPSDMKPETKTSPQVEAQTQPAPTSDVTAVPNNSAVSSANLPTNTKEENTLRLQGIMSQDGKNIALIDDQMYEEGEIIHKLKIKKITSKFVELEDKNGETLILKIK